MGKRFRIVADSVMLVSWFLVHGVLENALLATVERRGGEDEERRGEGVRGRGEREGRSVRCVV